LSPALVKQLEPMIEAEIAAALGRIADESSRSAAGRNVKEDLREMTLAIFLRAVYGVPSDAPAAERMRNLHGVITTERMVATPPGEMREAYEGLVESVREQGQRHEAAGTAPPDCVLAALQAADPAVRDDETMVGNLIYIAETGRTDVAGLLNWVVRKMAENPIWAERLRAEPDSDQGSAGLASRVVKETLRLEQSEYLLRSAREDLEVDGKIIPKGWLVRLCIREGHRDPAVFEDPERFDPDRFKDRTYTSREYAPFGLDNHRCLGTAWTEAIGRLFVSRLVRDYDLDVVDIGTTHHGTMHWEPGPDFRIRLTRRSQTA
jgi:cytochrome P450